MKIYPCIESTLEFPVGKYLCRLWIDEEEVKEFDHADLISKIKEISHLPLEAIIAFVSTLPKINAVQFKTKGFPEKGIVVYFVDFENDPHG